MLPRFASLAVVVLAALVAPGCGDDPASPRPRPQRRVESRVFDAELEIPDPRPRVRSVVRSEVLSESVTNWLSSVAAKIFVRDFDGLEESLAEDFLGHDPFSAGAGSTGAGQERELPLAARHVRLDATTAATVNGHRWLASLEERIGPWQRIELAHWNVARADFQIDEDGTWGAASLGLRVVGVTETGGRESIHASFRARVELTGASWRVRRMRLLELEVARKADPVFVDVTRPAGVFHEGIRYGQEGNDTDAWNGVACGDVDGDGLWDVFVPSSLRNFLYLNRGDGTFAEEAGERGLLGIGGGTGAVFFDADNDGDQDLVVGQVGWFSVGGEPRGRRLQYYENDGEGRFVEAAEQAGLEVYAVASSLTAFDHDGDGWTDLFVCGYGRMVEESNDSWVEALNGAPNVLLRNAGGERFEDVTKAAGLDDRRWSYAAAACDFDRDGDQDLYVGNNFGSNRLWRNAGDGTFEDVAEDLGVAESGLTMGVRWADLNNDGLLDLYLARPSSHTGHRVLERLRERKAFGPLASLEAMAAGNRLLLQRADGTFRAAAEGFGAAHAGWSWSPACADFDLDGALDVFCVNGFVTGDLPQDT